MTTLLVAKTTQWDLATAAQRVLRVVPASEWQGPELPTMEESVCGERLTPRRVLVVQTETGDRALGVASDLTLVEVSPDDVFELPDLLWSGSVSGAGAGSAEATSGIEHKTVVAVAVDGDGRTMLILNWDHLGCCLSLSAEGAI